MKNNFTESEETSSLDLFLTVGLVFLLFLALTYVHMRPENKNKANIQSNAQFTVTMEWDAEDPSDVDLYLKNPLGQVCYFNNRDFPLTHLDRDDRGTISDKVLLPNGEIIEVKENREIISIRGLVKGEYIVNVHQFAARNNGKPTKVKVTVEKINPSVTKIYHKEVILEQTGHEIHICRFVLDESGNVVDVNDDLPVELISTKPTQPPFGG